MATEESIDWRWTSQPLRFFFGIHLSALAAIPLMMMAVIIKSVSRSESMMAVKAIGLIGLLYLAFVLWAAAWKMTPLEFVKFCWIRYIYRFRWITRHSGPGRS